MKRVHSTVHGEKRRDLLRTWSSILDVSLCGALLHGSGQWRCGLGGRRRTAPPLTPDARLAIQVEPGPPPPHSEADAEGDELARVRRQPAPAREPDGVVLR